MKVLPYTGAWMPVFSLHNLEYTKGEPQTIKIFNRDWVVWRDNKFDVWSVQEDKCPHKFAPLSQGRVDQNSGCLECPYHGWQFNFNGSTVKIPQNENKVTPFSINNIITYVTGDILWGFFPKHISSIDEPIEILPEYKYEFLNYTKDEKYFIKELPYSWDILVENFMDPAHIPFAHHGLQGKRSDGKPIKIKLKNSNKSHCEIFFEDSMNSKKRNGIISFHSPSHFSYSTLRKNNEYKSNINVLTVPVKHGASRVFMISPFSKSKLPKWLQHAATNRFLNTDIWLHEAEINYRNGEKEYLAPSNSDQATIIFRRWWRTNKLDESLPHTFGPAPPNSLTKISRSRQINSWNTHSKNCKDCKDAANFFRRFKFFPILFSTLYVLTLQRIFVHFAIISGFGSIIAERVLNIIYGEMYVNKRSASAIKD